MASKILSALHFISLGQYHPKLYHKKKATQSSACAGLLTLAFALFSVTFTFRIFHDVIYNANYTIKQVPHIFGDKIKE